jgi:putative MATE family efflux protein
MELMQTPSELKTMSVLYLRIVSGSLIFQGISTSISALLRSFGKVKRAMTISIINTLITIIGNSLVILTPLSIFGEGIIGISVATVITRLIGAIISISTVKNTFPILWRGLFDLQRSDFQIGKEILRLGIPSGMENVSYNFSQTIITAVIASFGTIAINAKIYTQTITAVVFTISVAAGQTLQIFLGQYLREKKLREAKEFTFKVTQTFMSIRVIVNVLLAIFGFWIVQIFTSNPEIIQLVQILLWLNVFYDPSRVGNEILIAGLNVTGDVKYPVIIGILVTYLFTVPASMIFGGYLQLGLIMVWIIFILDEGLRVFIFSKRWKNNKWQKIFKERE